MRDCLSVFVCFRCALVTCLYLCLGHFVKIILSRGLVTCMCVLSDVFDLCVLPSCTDVNPAAAQCTLETSRYNGVSLQPIITDLKHTLGMCIFLFQDDLIRS